MSDNKRKKIRLQLRITPDKIDYRAVSWYTDATKLVKEIYGENWKLFVKLLASTSPRQSVKKNWKLSDALLKAYLDREDKPKKWGRILSDLMPAHLTNVLRSIAGRPIKGPKVSRFAANLLGDLSQVTIDVWICKAYKIDQNRLTPNVYKRLANKIKADAKRQGILPANYQAVLWYCIRRLSGKKVKSFLSVYRSIFCETPFFAFMADPE